jgi:hypothetical protein
MRRGRIVSGASALLVSLALSAPALAAPATAVDEGYPCATQPALPAGSPGCTEITTTPPSSTPVGEVGGTQVVTLTPASGTLGAQKTVNNGAAPASSTAGAPLAATNTSGTLPFTGAQLGIFAIVGLALLAGGLLLRSTGRSRTHS